MAAHTGFASSGDGDDGDGGMDADEEEVEDGTRQMEKSPRSVSAAMCFESGAK